ncbi:uncharacterized protein LOC122980512 isoform X2 [Thunnus albacares]|uniref:uncharacterized protein LOC122980512 isoform X2 n=1 Tax=Thunnus albacares TaxID=8236 RepID=UPI001CF613CC|nr:uncharacterized protein LOC122980512 isoform X2 [Thunnus albacares]
MVRTCAFDGCKSTTGLHSFPSDRHMARRWLQMAGRSLDSNTAAMYICNLHFSRECYSNYMEVELGFVSTCHLRLTPSAVPNPANFLPFPTPSRVFREVACQTESDPAVKETACQTCPVGLHPATVQAKVKPSKRSQDDYNRDMQSEMIRGAIKKLLMTSAVPALFGSDNGHGEGEPREKRSRIEVNTPSTAAKASTSVFSGSSVDTESNRTSVLTSGPSTSSQASFSGVQDTDVDTASPLPSVPVLIASGAPSTSSPSPPPAELREGSCSAAASKDCLNESSHQETELSSTTASKSDENTEKDLSGSRTIVNNSCLMELFKKCQTCGKPITKKNMSHCGAQTKVAWSCLGGHRGTWMSSPLLWDAFPEIHLLTALSIPFSGGSFTQFKTWAKHLHLNFMGHKTFFEIQKAYLNPETNRTEWDKILEVSQQLEGTLPHQISEDPLKEIKAKSKRRGSGTLSSLSRDKQCQQDDDDEHQFDSTPMTSEVDCLQDSFEEMEVTLDNDEFNSVKNRESDLHRDVDNVAATAKLSAPRADDSCDEDVYVPVIPQRSKMSELLLECEEEELEPWQKQTSHVHVKVEDDVGELSIDQIDCKPDPAPLQTNATPPKLKEESPQPLVFNSQGFIMASPQLTSNTEFIGSPGNSLPLVTAGQQQLFHKVSPAAVTPEAYDVIHTSEVQKISNNLLSLSSVQSPAVYATPSNQTTSQTLSVPFPLSCFTILELTSAQQTHNKL